MDNGPHVLLSIELLARRLASASPGAYDQARLNRASNFASATVVLKDGDASWIDASRKGVEAFDGPIMSQEAQMTGGYRFDTRS